MTGLRLNTAIKRTDSHKEMIMPYALNGTAHIYYEVEGEGPPLILQHGFTQSMQNWREFGWLAALRQDYRLILIDGRGHGESENEQSFRYSPQSLPQVKQFLQDMTPRAEQNRALVRRVVRAFNCADYAGLAQYYHAGWSLAGQANQQDPGGVQQLIGQIFRIFADAAIYTLDLHSFYDNKNHFSQQLNSEKSVRLRCRRDR